MCYHVHPEENIIPLLLFIYHLEKPKILNSVMLWWLMLVGLSEVVGGARRSVQCGLKPVSISQVCRPPAALEKEPAQIQQNRRHLFFSYSLQSQRRASSSRASCSPSRSQRRSLPGTSLVVQWLRVCASGAEGVGSVPSQGAKTPQNRQKIKTCLFN